MKGFSYPGKAPLKQTDDGLGDITVGTGLRGTSSGDSDIGGITREEMKDYIDKMYGNKELGDKYTETGDKVDETRKMSYGTWNEQLDLLYHDMNSGKGDKTGEWFKAVKKVKDDNPKS